MSDRPTQLRDFAELTSEGYGLGDLPLGFTATLNMLRESADEIERLTAERDEARAWGIRWRDSAAAYRALAEHPTWSGHIAVQQDMIRRNPAPWEEQS